MVFVEALVCLLIGTLLLRSVHYIREVTIALRSVRDQAGDRHFMNLVAQPEERLRAHCSRVDPQSLPGLRIFVMKFAALGSSGVQ
jgi:hypothetical protein